MRLVDVCIFYFDEWREGCESQRKTRKKTKICFVIRKYGILCFVKYFVEKRLFERDLYFPCFPQNILWKIRVFSPTKRTLASF
jgi:hypothetical protein